MLGHCLMLCKVPLLRLSKMQTLAPEVMNASRRWLPIKPALPVTNTFSISLVFISINQFSFLDASLYL